MKNIKFLIVLFKINYIEEGKLNEIIDYLPLKFIKIKKDDCFFILNYAFPFLSFVFRSLYFENLKLFYKTTILNINKKSQIGNAFDDLINLKIYENNIIGDITIKHRIIIDRINIFKILFQTINEKNNDDGEFDIYFRNYLNKQIKEIDISSIFKDHSSIFIQLFFQGKNFDGGIFIPFKNKEGNYNLFLYQTSIHKKIKFSRDYLYEQYILIKNNFEKNFCIKITDGFFSYILYYEDKDIETELHCLNNNISCIFYSINKDRFVDSYGKEVENILSNNSLIYKSDKISEFSRFQKEFLFFRNCLMSSKKEENEVTNASPNKNYLGKKIKISPISEDINNEEKKNTLKEKIELEIVYFNKIIKLNNSFIKQIEDSSDIKSYIDTITFNYQQKKIPKLLSIETEIKKCDLDFNKPIEDIRKLSRNITKKLNNEKLKMNEFKEIAKKFGLKYEEKCLIEENNNIIENEIENLKESKNNKKYNKESLNENNKIEENELSFNVKNKIKRKKLPNELSTYFKDYTKYIELGNFFFFELNIEREIPYIFLYRIKDEQNYKFLIYNNKGVINKIN